MTVVIGVDVCKGGWVFVRLQNGTFADAVFLSDSQMVSTHQVTRS